jgi:hypothetical protein
MALFGPDLILDAATALNAVSTEIGPVEAGNVNELTFYIVGSVGVASGAVQIEEAHITGYTGTWAPVGTATTVAATTVKTIKATGVGNVYRARVSTVMAGGSVSVWAMGR